MSSIIFNRLYNQHNTTLMTDEQRQEYQKRVAELDEIVKSLAEPMPVKKPRSKRRQVRKAK